MLLVGISLYRDFPVFHIQATSDLAALTTFATVWAYILPALFILAGGFLIVGRYSFITAWLGGVSLGSVAIGMFLKTLMTNFPLEDALTFVFPIFIWMIAFHMALQIPEVQESEDTESIDD